MTIEDKVTVNARWDKKLVPAGQSSQRNLLIELTAPPKPKQSGLRPPINMALVIDRSGSMGGSRLEAARAAAIGIVSALGEQDRLSIVVFDDEIDTLIDGKAMDAVGKDHAMMLIEQVQAGKMTDLGAGWFEGARCIARIIDASEFTQGHVLVLSDGQANKGVCDPQALLEHARELSGRGVKTSAVGIGANYSPLQLDALCEGGSGRLHDAESPEEIVEVVLGELGELHAITAHDVMVKIECPHDVILDLMTRSSVDREEGVYQVRLGDIAAGFSRPIAIRVDLPSYEQGEKLQFKITAKWRGSQEQQAIQREDIKTWLHVVPPHESDCQRADLDVVEKIATLFEAVIGYRAMSRNERLDYEGAVSLYDENRNYYRNLVSELPDAYERLDRLERVSDKVSRRWDGRSKRKAFASSTKTILAESDLRKKDQGKWFDNLDERF